MEAVWLVHPLGFAKAVEGHLPRLHGLDVLVVRFEGVLRCMRQDTQRFDEFIKIVDSKLQWRSRLSAEVDG